MAFFACKIISTEVNIFLENNKMILVNIYHNDIFETNTFAFVDYIYKVYAKINTFN